MTAFILRRSLQSIVVLFIMSLIVFVGVNLVGDPVDMLINPEADQAEIDRVIRDLGLDRPVSEQYWYFVLNAFQGDLGRSFIFGEPALKLIVQRMPATMELALVSLLMAVVFGIPLGIYAGLKPTSKISKTIMAGSILGFSMPTFWVGIILIMFFSVHLGWLPSTGRGDVDTFFGVTSSVFTLDGLSHIFLPAFNLALFKLSSVIRLARAGTREVILQDYIKFARAKGLAESRVVRIHLLKNIMIPVITIIGLEFGSLIAFSTVTETVFAWPGMGKLIIDSIYNLDRPVVVAYLMIIVVIFVMLNLIVDILYSVLDPRVRIKGVS
ncbi:ABC transporter permease [Alphaproteobacteria bacterium]|jgi:peptide/nickel transport system permease protein|nr:ABC transporter permease [Alphaproteobacteria bacterium]MDC1407506.1 ABC transporter permease [Candidatus Puniceispirillum sp.]MDB2498390.1 ABC transporter permease [Alphaproteobacteria bacterium]MDB2531993.1 ABC transporter permease [Alphaproteobacteria bacterium]MDB4857615.1 ABC transporter permease [Alphaproteobacteria bacterium]